MTIFRKGEVSDLIYDAAGGANSPMREPITVQLGNPTTNEVYVPPELRKYEGEVYIFDRVGDFSLADTEDTERDDSPPAVYSAFMPAGSLPSGKRKFGTTVKVVWREGRYEVVRETIVGANYNAGVPENEHSPVTAKDIDYGLLRPTDPPSGRVVLSGARHPISTTWYDIALQTSDIDLIATHADDLTLGQGRAVQIEVDPTDQSITYTAGSAFTNTSRNAETGAVDHSGVFANYPVGADASLKHYGWVLLYYQMTAITEQDILVTPDYGRGAGVSTLDGLTDVILTTPANGEVLKYNGSEWVNDTDATGGGSGLSEGYKLRGSGDTCGSATSTQLTFSEEIYDTGGYYDMGANEQTPSVGRWMHTAYVALALSDTTAGAGYISVYITGEYADELPVLLTQLTVLTPSGLTGDILLAFPMSTIGNIDTPNEFQLWVDNFSGEDAVTQAQWIEGSRLGDQL